MCSLKSLCASTLGFATLSLVLASPAAFEIQSTQATSSKEWHEVNHLSPTESPAVSIAVELRDLRGLVDGLVRVKGNKKTEEKKDKDKKDQEKKDEETTSSSTSKTPDVSRTTSTDKAASTISGENSKAIVPTAAAGHKTDATAAPSKTEGRTSSSRATSSSQNSASACPTRNPGQKSSSLFYSAKMKPNSFESDLKKFKKFLNEPGVNCFNNLLLFDKHKTKPQYLFAWLNSTGYDTLKKLSGTEKIYKEDKEEPIVNEPQVETVKARERPESLFRRLIRRARVISSSLKPGSWGLSRISIGQTGPVAQAGYYAYPDTAGQGVDIYVVDYSVGTPPPDSIGSRLTTYLASDYVRDSWTATNPHGLRVAAVAAGATMGVARKANVISVAAFPHDVQLGAQIVQDSDELELSRMSLASALEKVREHLEDLARNRASRPSVINLSSEAHRHWIVNLEVQRLIDEREVPVIYGAGNTGKDACTYGGLFSDWGQVTIGTTDVEDKVHKDSNYGSCVHQYAPGVKIRAPKDNVGTQPDVLVTGTSIATPHVAGTVAIMLGLEPNLKPPEIKRRLLAASGWALDGHTNSWVRLLQMTGLFPGLQA